MIKLSTKSRYSVRLMFELGISSEENPVELKTVAQKQNLSEKYLSKLVIPLKSAGLITALRGAHGGYVLQKNPSEITIKEIVEASEGKISLVDCLHGNPSCENYNVCPTKKLWSNLENHITDFLENITLKDIIEDYNKNENKESLIYHI